MTPFVETGPDALDQRLAELEHIAANELPADFAARVLRHLPPRPRPLLRWLQAAGLAGGGAYGLAQLLSYMAGVWLAGAAA